MTRLYLPNWMKLLYTIRYAEEYGQKEYGRAKGPASALSYILQIPHSGVSKVLADLERHKLIERKKIGRYKEIKLTPAGEKVATATYTLQSLCRRL